MKEQPFEDPDFDSTSVDNFVQSEFAEGELVVCYKLKPSTITFSCHLEVTNHPEFRLTVEDQKLFTHITKGKGFEQAILDQLKTIQNFLIDNEVYRHLVFHLKLTKGSLYLLGVSNLFSDEYYSNATTLKFAELLNIPTPTIWFAGPFHSQLASVLMESFFITRLNPQMPIE